ncbi:superfamily II DNA/RNA helicase [Pelomonas aquatica]|uniref:Superfamily II DNA/RNA helicase n=1 Tax=Pelomonas aquatica TaxID=431058 RepID=A0ABU1Z824_9BURK|nr:DEAD/DEAH box helicase [Pelomonas aquatica]MDR7296145.1 superfamily II DNA/RNA helicase [Pelomonas aquatica]
MSFDTLGLNEVVLKAVKESGYENATDVQTLAIPAAIANKDLMVSARTGSGKTAAFILPALEKILAARGDDSKRREKGKIYGPKILVLAPTRELAMQVSKAAQTYGRFIPGLKVATVLGGMPYPLQIRQLTGPLDILIATPGRLIDHIQSGKCVLANVEMLVLDEADRMLDMGFIDDISMIASHTPAERQTVMFSATFAGHVGRLAQDLLKEPQRIEVANHTDTHENIEQRLHWADNPHHKDQLLESILALPEMEQAVVFTSTQRDADWLAERLAEIGHSVAPLHGAMPQGKRNRVLMGLRRGDVRVLVATDVAARGIDVPTISHVINYGLPMKAEDYVHRIGRTGRAGRQGLAITLGLRDDVSMIRRIQQFTTQTIPVQQIAGLEPKTQEPRIFPPRPAGSFDDRGPRGHFGGGGRPGFGNKPFRREDGGRPFQGGGKPFGQDRGFAPRQDGFQPRQDERGFAPRDDRGFQPRDERSFAPRQDDRGFQPRGDRPFNAGGKPAFGGKPSFGGGGGRPAFDGERRPAGPRKGGFGR